MKFLPLAIALLATPVFADTVTVETYSGAVDAPLSPTKIVVFDVAALDTLDALGITPAGTVSNVYVDYLGDATSNSTAVGSLFEPGYEAIALLAPDLIVAGGRSSKVVPDLAKIAPTIDMTIWEDTVGQGLVRLNTYGKIFGKKAQATALKTEFNNKRASATSAASKADRALIVMANDPRFRPMPQMADLAGCTLQ